MRTLKFDNQFLFNFLLNKSSTDFGDCQFASIMDILEQGKIPLQNLSKKQEKNRLFGDKSLILTKGESFIKIQKITNNLIKELQTSQLSSMIVVDLFSLGDKEKFDLASEKIKITFQVPVKKLFDVQIVRENKIDEFLLNLDLSQLFRGDDRQKSEDGKEKEKEQEKQKEKQKEKEKEKEKSNDNENKKFSSWAIRVFPFHKSINFVSMNLPEIIVPLSQYDILSYQKNQRISNYQYIFALPEYEQKVAQKLQTEIYLNWGDSEIEFIINNESSQENTMILKNFEIIIIPARSTYTWKVRDSSNSIGKLLNWKILPKKTLPIILANLDQQQRNFTCSYSIFQVLIDYCFHQFSLIEAENQEFMYNLANILRRQFGNELITLEKELNFSQSQVLNASPDKKVDQCQNCGKFIVNYFGYYRNLVYCLDCVKRDFKIQTIFQKIPKSTFEEGCEILTRIRPFKDQKKNENQNVQKLIQNAVFFQYEDICDGDFIGSYNSIHCKINDPNTKKVKNSKQKIVQNTINQLKKDLSISSVLELIKKYSKKPYQNEQQRKLNRQILTRIFKFMSHDQQNQLLSQMLPSHKENNLQLFAIQLCAKDKT